MVVDVSRLGMSVVEKGAQRLCATAAKEMTSGTRQAHNAQSVVKKLSTTQVPEKAKSFTRHNYRENLIRLTGVDPGKEVHAHHVFPQHLRDRFAEIGINIDDPKYLTWWGPGHLSNAKEYNAKWAEFLETKPTVHQILQKGKEIMSGYEMTTHY